MQCCILERDLTHTGTHDVVLLGFASQHRRLDGYRGRGGEIRTAGGSR